MSPPAQPSGSITLRSPKREPFDLYLHVEPVWKVKRGLIMSFLVERNGAAAKLDASDLEGMDVATMA